MKNQILENALYETDEEHYYQPIKTKVTCKDSNIEYESNGDKYKNLPISEYLEETKIN